MRFQNRWKLWLLPLMVTIFVVGCQQNSAQTLPTPAALVEEEPELPTATPVPPATATPLPTATPMPPTPTVVPTDTPAPTDTPVAPTATAIPPTTPATTYRVVLVTEDDTLNLRGGPGVSNPVVGTLPYQADDIRITGPAETVSGSTWVPVEQNGLTGWVNRYYLTEAVTSDQFCSSAAGQQILNALQASIAVADGNALRQLIHPERGLLIRHNWWNPEVRLSPMEVANFFSSATSYDWGVADGSGNPIMGSPSDIIVPLLEKDLLPATATGCNEIVGGNTAGILRVPAEYETLNYISAFRPPPTPDDFDWGIWVVGIEFWEGNPYLAFLIHYQWEI